MWEKPQPQCAFGDERGNASHTTNHRSGMCFDRTWLLCATESYQTTCRRTDHGHPIREKGKALFNARVNQPLTAIPVTTLLTLSIGYEYSNRYCLEGATGILVKWLPE
jgi:hypothetical protein